MFWLGYAGMPRRVLDYPTSLGGWHSLISGGHLLSVAGIIAFFFMIFDSVRQSRAALRNTLGINRYNTRLNFYIYEAARLKLIKQKFGYLFLLKFKKMNRFRRRPVAFFAEYETTIISYAFKQKKRQKTK
jgi:heme/copper-type cytochrome/quinol oxidase subunit 1